MYCWICGDVVFNEYYLLPTDDLVADKEHVVKNISVFKFLYRILCDNCLDIYIKNYPTNFRKLQNRELGIQK